MTAGVVAARADNGFGMAGINWDATLFNGNMDDEPGLTGAINDIRSAILPPNSVQILNMSWHVIEFSPTLRLALRDAYMLNVASIASMGNHNNAVPVYPAAYGTGIIAVGGIGLDGLRWETVFGHGSNTGDHIDVVAPAEFVWAPKVQENLNVDPIFFLNHHDGTSAAAPHVTGIAGLLKAHSTVANDDIEQLIRISAEHPFGLEWDSSYGTGLAKAGRAIELLESGRLYQLTAHAGNASLGAQLVNEGWKYFHASPCPQVPGGGRLWVRTWEVGAHVQFQATFTGTPVAWGRGAATKGYKDEEPNYAMGWCEAYDVTSAGCKLRTYVYEVWDPYDPGLVCWAPVEPTQVVLAYTVFGYITLADAAGTPGQSVRLVAENPFRPRGMVFLEGAQGSCQLSVFDVRGRMVRVLHDGPVGSERQGIRWDGRDSSGHPVGSGVYVVQLQSNSRIAKNKIVLVR